MKSTMDCRTNLTQTGGAIIAKPESPTTRLTKSVNSNHRFGACAPYLIFAVVLVLPTLAAAATYYVNPVSGNDSANGSASNPWQTIGKAKTTAGAGDIVNLMPGSYGSVTFGQSGDRYGSSWNTPITFQNNPASPPYSAKFSHVLFSGSQNFYITISGLDVTNTGSKDSCIKTEGASQVRIIDCKAHGNAGGSGPSYAVIFTKNANNILIEDCEVYHGGSWSFAIQLEDSDSVTVRGCHVHDIVGSGIRTGGGQNYFIENNIVHDQRAEWNPDVHGSGIAIHSNNTVISGNIVYNYGNTRPIRFYQSYAGSNGYRNMLVENNLVYKTSDFRGTQWWVEFIDVGTNCVFRNNTFVDSTIMVFAQNADGSGLSIHNNVFTGGLELNDYNASASGPGRTKWNNVSEGNNIYGNLIAKGCGYQCSYSSFSPTSNSIVGTSFGVGTFFASGAAHYPYGSTYPYQLSGSSLAINFGSSAYAPITDLLGAARIGAPDAGCYEYGSAPAPQNQPPTANAGSDQTITAAPGSAQVTLNGSASTDSDGTIVSFVWTENSQQIATGPNPTVTLSTGQHDITLTVTDNDGAADSDSVTITVEAQDVTAPEILAALPARNSLTVIFDEELDTASAENVANYNIDNDTTITNASLNASEDTVTLTTSDHIEQLTYTLTVTNVADIAGNKISQASKTYMYTSGLLGYWKLDEAAGLTALDSSGNDNIASLVNGPLWNQMQGITFDGLDDYLNCGSDPSLNLTGSLTITASINAKSFGQNGWGRIVDKSNGSNGFSFFVDGSTASLAYVIYGGALTNSQPQVVHLNNDQHVAVVYDQNAQTATFYADAQQVGTVAYTTPPADSADNPLVIGIRGYDLNRAFDGTISSVRIYDHALNADEILEVFNNDYPFLIQPIGDKTVDENSDLTFTVDPLNPDVILAIQDHDLPSDPDFTDNTFNWSPTYDDAGIYQTTFLATYGQIEDFETISITVNNINRPPALDAIADQAVDENALLTFIVTASDPDGENISYSASNLPAGAIFAADTFQWTPESSQIGTYQVTFTASDGSDQDSQTISITVNDTATGPEEIIIDNTDSATSSTGNWYVSGGADPYGDDSLWSRDGTTFTWSFTPAVSGYYDLDMYWTGWPSRTAGIPVRIEHQNGTNTVYINQQQNACQWNTLGKFPFIAGQTYNVTITSQPDPASTCADAVKFTLTSPPPIVIDNGDPQTSSTGLWCISGAADPYGTESLWARNGYTYTWTFNPVVTGQYDLAMYWTTWPSRSSNVPVRIENADGLTTVYIDQQQNGSQFNTLGRFVFNAGQSYDVTIISQPGPSSTCADAVKFIFVEP